MAKGHLKIHQDIFSDPVENGFRDCRRGLGTHRFVLLRPSWDRLCNAESCSSVDGQKTKPNKGNANALRSSSQRDSNPHIVIR